MKLEASSSSKPKMVTIKSSGHEDFMLHANIMNTFPSAHVPRKISNSNTLRGRSTFPDNFSGNSENVAEPFVYDKLLG